MASNQGSTLPSIPKDPRSEETDPCRLWIGNLDPQLTEFQLLKVLQKFGKLEKFDYLYHKAGPDAGKPRGYCFVTYNNTKEAANVQKHLNNKKIGSRHLVVKQAHSATEESRSQVNPSSQPVQSTPSLSTSTQIAAIEAKLKMMQQSEDVTSFLPKTVPSVSLSSQSSTGNSSSSASGNTTKISKLAEVALASGMKPAKPRTHYSSTHRGKSKPYSR